jgi:glucose-1-phosphate cytidylyltransferase
MKAVLLAGGLGTRLREETEFRPKPMVEIGGKPIIWHIMKNLSVQGVQEFIICTGYKGEMIKNFFVNYELYTNDTKIELGILNHTSAQTSPSSERWTIEVKDTGQATMTGGRLFKIRESIQDDYFLCTYGDGLSNIDLHKLVAFHKSHKKIATVTAVHPVTRFGAMEIGPQSQVDRFREKPTSDQWVNGGFFLFSKEIFKYLDDKSVLENEPLENLVADNELMAYKHEDFWQPMDTYRETQELNGLWESNQAPWRNW